MAKSDHLLAVLWMLRARKKLTASYIAGRLEMSVRTVYRYIDALCASGVPIVAESGHEGGFSLSDNFRDAPFVLGVAEMAAISHAADLAGLAGSPERNTLRGVVKKIGRTLSDDQLEQVRRRNDMFAVVGTGKPAQDSGYQQPIDNLHIIELAAAAVAHGTILLVRYSRPGETPTDRWVEPYALAHRLGKWYLVAYCRLRRDMRLFRTDRILAAQAGTESFSRPAGFSAEEFVEQRITQISDGEGPARDVELGGTESSLRQIRAHWYMRRVLHSSGTETSSFRIPEEIMERYLPDYLISFGSTVRVLGPPRLRDLVRERIRAIADLYE
jgi:predicted DNA-binding transcriptional regulator YafY